MNPKINELCKKLEERRILDLIANKVDCPGNRENSKVNIKEKRKHINIDFGGAGKFIIDPYLNVWTIKAYGQKEGILGGINKVIRDVEGDISDFKAFLDKENISYEVEPINNPPIESGSRSEEITEQIKKAILKDSYKDEDDRLKIDIGNCRLDFSQNYFLNGFTKKSVKLSWINGDSEVNVLGKVEKRGEGKYSLYTEGWQFIKTFEIEDMKGGKEE